MAFAASSPQPGFLKRRVVQPVMGLLRSGMSVEKLSWSIALGLAVGVNPLLGSTTVLTIALCAAFRANQVAAQIANHLVYPLELLLFPVFLALGGRLFHDAAVPLRGGQLLAQAKAHPWDTTRLLWHWEWHALLVWAVLAGAGVPVLAFTLRPALRRLQRRSWRKTAPAAV